MGRGKLKTQHLFVATTAGMLLLAATLAANSFGSKGATDNLSKGPMSVSPEEAQQAAASARGLSVAFRLASEKVLPSVVAIEKRAAPVTVQKQSDETKPEAQPFGDRNPFEGTPFEDMFKDNPFGKEFRFEGPRLQPRPYGSGMGSGVIIDAKGVILTNNHVVDGGGDVIVRLHDGREYPAVKVWNDPKTDIAVVKIDGAKDLVAAKLGNSDSVAVGDWVLALGQPFGLESTVTAGIISAKHRGIGITSRENFLQTDAAINPGNSGGPLVNLNGEVVGINTAISSRSGGNDGIGFAVPINLARWVSGQLADGGVVQRAYLGVGIQPVTQQLADHFQVKPREGVAVTQVYPDTPAAQSGLQAGDVIVAFAGSTVTTPQELQLIVERAEIGKAHAITIVRDGKRMDLAFTAKAQPDEFGAVASRSQRQVKPKSSKLDAIGIEISSLDADVAKELGLKVAKGVVITDVRADSPAARSGLRSGMVITQVNQRPVQTIDDVRQALQAEKSAGSVLMLVRTTDGSRFVVIKL